MPTTRKIKSRKETPIKMDSKWKWGSEQVTAFHKLKEILSSPPILGYPNYELPFLIHTDDSRQGLGAILYQKQKGLDRVIAYMYVSISLKQSKIMQLTNWNL